MKSAITKFFSSKNRKKMPMKGMPPKKDMPMDVPETVNRNIRAQGMKHYITDDDLESRFGPEDQKD